MLGRVVTVRKFSHRLIDLMSHRYHRGGGSFVFLAFLRFEIPCKRRARFTLTLINISGNSASSSV